jgi:hypothetical protein
MQPLGPEHATRVFGAALAWDGALADLACTTVDTKLEPLAGKPIALPGACVGATELRARADGRLAIAVTTSADRIQAVVDAAGRARTVRIEAIPRDAANPASFDGPAAAAGDGWGAVAYRSTRSGVSEIHLVALDANGMKGKPVLLDSGLVGAPSLAFHGDTLHVVWAKRESTTSPDVLRVATWRAGGVPTPPQRLMTIGRSAFAPSLAIDGEAFALAWMEGDATNGVVKAGMSRVSLVGAMTHAGIVSSGSAANARDPAIALDGDSAWVVWKELSAKKSELRATALDCIE